MAEIGSNERAAEMSLRAGMISDIGTMALLMERATAYRYRQPLPDLITDHRRLQELHDRMNRDGAWCYAVHASDEMAGFVMGHPALIEDAPLTVNTEYLALLMTEPAHWGKGVGHLLIETAATTATRAGKAHMTLWTGEHNTRARRLYERNGFEPTNHTRISQWQGPLVLYRRDLPSRPQLPDA